MTKKLVKKESQIQSEILKFLRLQGCFVFKWGVGGTYIPATGKFIPSTFKGAPDIGWLYKGRFIGIEVKTPTGEQSPIQKAFEKFMVDNGGEYYIARSLLEAKALYYVVTGQEGRSPKQV